MFWKKEKQRWLCCPSSLLHWCKDVSWSRCWGFPWPQPRTVWCHDYTTVGSIKNIHFLVEPMRKQSLSSSFFLFQGLGAQPVASTAPEEQRLCCPCSRAFLSAAAINPRSRVVMNTASVWGVKRPLLCFSDSPNAALIWRCQAADCLCGTNWSWSLAVGLLVFFTTVSVAYLFVFKLIMDQC